MQAAWKNLVLSYLTEYKSIGMKIVSVIVDYIYGSLFVDTIGSLPYYYIIAMILW